MQNPKRNTEMDNVAVIPWGNWPGVETNVLHEQLQREQVCIGKLIDTVH